MNQVEHCEKTTLLVISTVNVLGRHTQTAMFILLLFSM